MKTFIFSIAICLFGATLLPAQGIVTKPDLVGRIQQSGAKLVITVDNLAPVNPNNASGKARSSSAKLNLGGQEQTIQVPELQPDGQFKKEIPIPTSLLNKSFTATLKVDAGGVVVESNENNNTFSATFNAPDLTPGMIGGFVKFDIESGFYMVHVKNIGVLKSGAFTTRVTYRLKDNQTKVELGLTPEIAAGSFARVKIPMPPRECYQAGGGTCYFTVELDVNGAVKETLETNNREEGRHID